MKSAFWLVFGTGLGFVLAHLVNSTSSGRSAFEAMDARTRGFTDALLDGYRSRDAELRGESETTAA